MGECGDPLPVEVQQALSLTIEERPNSTIIRVRGRSAIGAFIITFFTGIMLAAFAMPFIAVAFGWPSAPPWFLGVLGLVVLAIAVIVAFLRANDPLRGGRTIEIDYGAGVIALRDNRVLTLDQSIPIVAITQVSIRTIESHTVATFEGETLYVGGAAGGHEVQLLVGKGEDEVRHRVLDAAKRRDADSFAQWLQGRLGLTTTGGSA